MMETVACRMSVTTSNEIGKVRIDNIVEWCDHDATSLDISKMTYAHYLFPPFTYIIRFNNFQIFSYWLRFIN